MRVSPSCLGIRKSLLGPQYCCNTKYLSNQRGPRGHRESREYIPRLSRAGKSRTPSANSKIIALLRDSLIHCWDSSLILIVVPIEHNHLLFETNTILHFDLNFYISNKHFFCTCMLWGATRNEIIEKLQWTESTAWNKPTLQLNFSST